MRLLAMAMGVAGTLAIGLSAAQAEVTTFARAGGWRAFGGTTNNGKMVCGVSTEGGGRWFGVKYFHNDDALTVQLSKDSWKVKDGTKVRVQMQFDDESAWSARATAFHMSDGDAALEFEVPSKAIGQWLGEFRRSNTLFVRFPDSNVDDWRANLAGTSEIADRMGDCLRAMRKASH
ncbi:MAG: hypothetical protein AB7O80_18510 [Acetobacteraceae bacterium]